MFLKARGVRGGRSRRRLIDNIIRRARTSLLRKGAALMVAMAMIVMALVVTAMALSAPETLSDVIAEANAPERKVLGDDDIDFSAFGGRDKLCNRVKGDTSCEDCTDLSNIIIGAPEELKHLLTQLKDLNWKKPLYGSTLDGKQGKERHLCYDNDGAPSLEEVKQTGTENTYKNFEYTVVDPQCEQLGDGIERCDIPFQTLFDNVDFENFDRTLDADLIRNGLTRDTSGNEQLHLRIQGVDMTLYQGTPEFTKLKRAAADSAYNEQAYLAWPKRALWRSTVVGLKIALSQLTGASAASRDLPMSDLKNEHMWKGYMEYKQRSLSQEHMAEIDTEVHVTWTSGTEAKEDVITMAGKMLAKLDVGDEIKMIDARDLDKTEYSTEFWGGSSDIGYDPTDAKYEAWYPNFADKRLFYLGKAWFTGQDETAALEHPLLLGLREWLIKQNTGNCPFRDEPWNEFLPKAPQTPNFGRAYCRQFLGKGSMVVRNLPLLFKIERGYPKLNKTTQEPIMELNKKGEMVVKKVSIYGDEKALLRYCGVTKDPDSKKYPVLGFHDWDKKTGDDKFDFLGQEALVGTSQPAEEVDLWAKRTNMYIAAHPVNVGSYFSPEKLANRQEQETDDAKLELLTRPKTLICNELEDPTEDGQPRQCKASTCVGTKQIQNFATKDYDQITEAYLRSDEAFSTTLTLDKERYLCYDEPDSKRALFYNHGPGATGLHLQYSVEQIKQTFSVILNTFAMIKQSSKNPGNIELHIGNLGAGIFGNNLNTVMLLQLIAAKSVGVERVVYHGKEIGKRKSQNNLQGPLIAFRKCYIKNQYTLKEFFDENLIKCITKKQEFEVGTYTSF